VGHAVKVDRPRQLPHTKAYLCLGSNIEPEKNIRFAVQRLLGDFDKVKISNLYRSAAVGFVGDDFLNLALSVNTDLSLEDLLAYTNTLEKEAGRIRVRRGRYDSRTLDIDVVMYGDLQGEYAGREWPSEDINENAHVLLPISEIAGGRLHPALGVKFAQLWREFDQDELTLERVDWVW